MSELRMSSWEEDEARTRALFREVNERIAELGDEFQRDGHSPFVCECGNQECRETLELTLPEYEAVRAHARRFVIALDHENPTLEIVLGQDSRYAIVETLVGEASRVAEETDPRGQVSTDSGTRVANSDSELAPRLADARHSRAPRRRSSARGLTR